MGKLFQFLTKNLRDAGLLRTAQMAIDYLRGFFLSLRFARRGLIMKKGRVHVSVRNGRVVMDNYVRLWPDVRIVLNGTKAAPAVLSIGSHSTIGNRTEIHAAQSVTIGRNVMISWDCVIMDRNYHGLDGHEESLSPVVIRDDAWIGCRVIILKGVTIGKGAVIGAGSVVTHDVPDGAVAAGNPARIIREKAGASKEFVRHPFFKPGEAVGQVSPGEPIPSVNGLEKN